MLPAYQPPDHNDATNSVPFNKPYNFPEQDNSMQTSHIDVSDNVLKPFRAPQLSPYSVWRPLSGVLSSVTLFLSILSEACGLIFVFGPVELTVNGAKTMVDESKYLGPGLLWLSGFFVIIAVMCLIVLILHYRKKPNQPRPFGYVFLASLVPLCFAVYNFCRRVGFSTARQQILFVAIVLGGVMVSILPITYSFAIARGF